MRKRGRKRAREPIVCDPFALKKAPPSKKQKYTDCLNSILKPFLGTTDLVTIVTDYLPLFFSNIRGKGLERVANTSPVLLEDPSQRLSFLLYCQDSKLKVLRLLNLLTMEDRVFPKNSQRDIFHAAIGYKSILVTLHTRTLQILDLGTLEVIRTLNFDNLRPMPVLFGQGKTLAVATVQQNLERNQIKVEFIRRSENKNGQRIFEFVPEGTFENTTLDVVKSSTHVAFVCTRKEEEDVSVFAFDTKNRTFVKLLARGEQNVFISEPVGILVIKKANSREITIVDLSNNKVLFSFFPKTDHLNLLVTNNALALYDHSKRRMFGIFANHYCIDAKYQFVTLDLRDYAQPTWLCLAKFAQMPTSLCFVDDAKEKIAVLFESDNNGMYLDICTEQNNNTRRRRSKRIQAAEEKVKRTVKCVPILKEEWVQEYLVPKMICEKLIVTKNKIWLCE